MILVLLVPLQQVPVQLLAKVALAVRIKLHLGKDHVHPVMLARSLPGRAIQDALLVTLELLPRLLAVQYVPHALAVNLPQERGTPFALHVPLHTLLLT